MEKLFLLFIIIFFTFFSCDIPGRIELINLSGADALYVLYREKEKGQIDTLTIEISGIEGKNKVGILSSFGETWTNEKIKEYFGSVQEMQIITTTDTIVFKEKEEMFNYFKERRKGVFNQTIRIKLK